MGRLCRLPAWLSNVELRLQLNYTHRDKGELNRNLFFFSAGFGW